MVCKEKARSEEHRAEKDEDISEEAMKVEADDGCRVASTTASYTAHPLH